MKNIIKFIFILAIYNFTCSCSEESDENSGGNDFTGVWVRVIAESGDETDLAIGNIPGEPENRVYMCEKEGSLTPGLFKGTIEENIITWDAQYALPNTQLRKIGNQLEFYYYTVENSLPTMYNEGTWSGDCTALGRQPGIYFTVVSTESPIVSYQDNNPLILNNLSPGTAYGPCGAGTYNFTTSLANGNVYQDSYAGGVLVPSQYTLSPPASGYTYRNYQLLFYFDAALNRSLMSFTYFDE